MEIIGYIALVLMGFTLGLMGAGGSILTLPILVYLLKLPIVKATIYSMVLVGSSALVAAIGYRKQIFFYKAILFAIPSIIGVFIARHYIMPNLPNHLFSISKDQALIILLITFMFFSGYFMISKHNYHSRSQNISSLVNAIKIFIIALTLGTIMGILGAGGGFIIIPTLVVFLNFNIKEAVPTSLLIISINSLMGFISDKHYIIIKDWQNLIKYLLCSIVGMFAGIFISKFVNNANLKRIFGYFIWLITLLIFLKEFVL